MSRWSYFGKRLLLSIPVLIFGITITFLLIRAGPISPAAAIAGIQNPQAIDRIRQQLGLNRPLWQQYIEFMTNLFTLHLGQSWVFSRNTSVVDLLAIYAPRTLWLGFWSVLIALFIGIPLGFYAGLNPNTGGDYFASFSGIVWRAMPNFWLAIILIGILSDSQNLLFGFDWQHWLVSTDIVQTPDLAFFGHPFDAFTNPRDWWIEPRNGGSFLAALKQIAPAAIVLGSASMGNEMRIGRTAVLETVNSEYVETARAKGVSDRTLVWKHIFRNALIPLVPIITNEAFILIGGSVIVETVFNINGMGYMFYQASLTGDLPLLGALMFIFILLTVGLNLFQDFLYTVVDPRIGYDGAKQ